MRLINCPLCGTRCSAETEKCPECGFEIKDYFTDKKQDSSKHKNPVIYAGIIAAAVVVAAIFIVIAFQNKLSTLNHSESSESLETIFPTDTTEESQKDIAPQTADSSIDVSGVYSGDDHEILVLNTDGLAYYYCVSIEFTELQCPWYVKDDNVYIEFSRLHCTVVAKIDEKELIFKSDSANWNTELFSKLDVEPDQYLTKALKTNDPNATLNYDGTLTYNLDGIEYTLPKSFIDMEDDFDNMDDCSAFIDQDVQTNYISSAFFYKLAGKTLDENSAKELVSTFASGFYDNISVDSCTATEIAGHQGYICEISGYLNEGFRALQNYEISGYIVVFYNEKTKNDNFIMLVQNSHRSTDNTSIFGDILKSAK